MKILMHNCQGITDGVITLPPNSLVEFVGDNSNGKSTVSRYIEHMNKGDLHLAAIREPLIKDGCQSSQFVMVSDVGSQLVLVLYRESGKSYLVFIPDENNPTVGVSRPISDADGCKKILHKFGFRSYANGDICLNLAPTFGGIPLVTTAGKTNFEIIDDFSKDAVADEFLKGYKEITRPIFNQKIKAYTSRKQELERLVAVNLYPDWEFCKTFHENNEALARALASIVFMEPIDYVRPQAYNIVEMTPVTYRRPCAFLYKYCMDMTKELREVVEYNNKRCPNCGRQYLEDDVCITENCV